MTIYLQYFFLWVILVTTEYEKIKKLFYLLSKTK
jgi:hypothetical protein